MLRSFAAAAGLRIFLLWVGIGMEAQIMGYMFSLVYFCLLSHMF